jgi:hypothetical protein
MSPYDSGTIFTARNNDISCKAIYFRKTIVQVIPYKCFTLAKITNYQERNFLVRFCEYLTTVHIHIATTENSHRRHVCYFNIGLKNDQ